MPAADLGSFYSSGAILIHLRPSGFVLDSAAKVTAITNAGAAGSMFDASVQGEPLTVSGRGVLLPSDPTASTIVSANPADLMGVRLIWVMDADTLVGRSNVQIFGLDGALFVDLVTSLRFDVSNPVAATLSLQSLDPTLGNSQVTSPAFEWPSGLAIFEVVLDETSVDLFIANDLVVSATHSLPSPFPVQQLGSGVTSPQAGYAQHIGFIGDVLGILVGHPDEVAARGAAYSTLSQ